jgi:bacillithiol biosynthesis deacetylase BshB1
MLQRKESTMAEPLDLLVVGAHPDDAEMTSGGWIALASKQGHRTGILHLTRGEMGTHGTAETRETEARNAAKILGCAEIAFAGLQDGFVDDGNESVRIVVDWIRRLKPKIVLAPWFKCHHPDHEAAARLTRKAVHFAGLRGYKTDLPEHRTHRLVHARYSQYFEPSFYVDISSVIETKQEAILAYASQFQTVVEENGKPLTRMSKPEFIDQFLATNAFLGLRCATRYAEAYRVGVGPVVADPVKLLGDGPAQHLLR